MIENCLLHRNSCRHTMNDKDSPTDGPDSTHRLDRRTALKRLGTAGVGGAIGLVSTSAPVAAEVIPEGNSNEVYDQEKLSHTTECICGWDNSSGEDVHVEQAVGLEIYHASCSAGEWEIPFQINLDAITTDPSDGAEQKNIRGSTIRIEFRSDHVLGTETSDDIGNWTYYDKQDDENYEDYAQTAISFTLSLMNPPTWAASSSVIASEMFFGNDLDSSGSTSDGFYDRYWHYWNQFDGGTLQSQTSEWCQFECTNLGYGEVLDVTIEWETEIYDHYDIHTVGGSTTKTFEAPWKNC